MKNQFTLGAFRRGKLNITLKILDKKKKSCFFFFCSVHSHSYFAIQTTTYEQRIAHIFGHDVAKLLHGPGMSLTKMKRSQNISEMKYRAKSGTRSVFSSHTNQFKLLEDFLPSIQPEIRRSNWRKNRINFDNNWHFNFK